MVDRIYTSDFETANNEWNITKQETWVWLWDICNIKTLEHVTGNTIDEWFECLYKIKSCVLYFHNLKFDGNFIISALLNQGYNWNDDGKHLKSKEFSALINDKKVFYQIVFKKGREQYTIRDSSKKIPGGVGDIAKSYNLPILKGEIDYKAWRPKGYTATKEEIEYIHNDTEIIARVLQDQYKLNMNKMTSASDSFKLYKQCIGDNVFKALYPVLDNEIDKFIRKTYRGGWCVNNPVHTGKIITDKVICYDVNSMYPHKMCESILPYGYPVYYKGEYVKDELYPLYCAHILFMGYVKDGYMPTILLNKGLFRKNAYLDDTGNEMLELYLTNIDLELLYSNYEIRKIIFIDGWKFKGSNKLFKKYIEPIYEKKCKSKGSEKQLNKILLNSLYGRFAKNPRNVSCKPLMNEEGIVNYITSTDEIGNPIYTAVASFITAYARKHIIGVVNELGNDFVYSDTDSIYCLRTPKDIEIHKSKLGAWDLEKVFVKSKFLAQKTYIGICEDGKQVIKVAGCPEKIRNKLDFESFKFGTTLPGKLIPKLVKGGVVLVDTDFTFKERL